MIQSRSTAHSSLVYHQQSNSVRKTKSNKCPCQLLHPSVCATLSSQPVALGYYISTSSNVCLNSLADYQVLKNTNPFQNDYQNRKRLYYCQQLAHYCITLARSTLAADHGLGTVMLFALHDSRLYVTSPKTYRHHWIKLDILTSLGPKKLNVSLHQQRLYLQRCQCSQGVEDASRQLCQIVSA